MLSSSTRTCSVSGRNYVFEFFADPLRWYETCPVQLPDKSCVSSFSADCVVLLRLSPVLFCCVLPCALSSFSHQLATVSSRVRIWCFEVDFGTVVAFERKLASAPIYPPLVGSPILHVLFRSAEWTQDIYARMYIHPTWDAFKNEHDNWSVFETIKGAFFCEGLREHSWPMCL